VATFGDFFNLKKKEFVTEYSFKNFDVFFLHTGYNFATKKKNKNKNHLG
jgi:hypothetical protein